MGLASVKVGFRTYHYGKSIRGRTIRLFLKSSEVSDEEKWLDATWQLTGTKALWN